jgi:transketolase
LNLLIFQFLKKMKKYTNTGSKDTRSGFGAGMTELGQKNENVVALCADLIGSLKFDDFKKNHPCRIPFRARSRY